jgi:acetyltransferase-like isoleucine patch superfamily enzyme
VGKVVTRLQAYGAQYQEELRQQGIAKICRFHPTATIGSCAGFSNASGNPDDISIGADSAVLGEFVIFPQGGRIKIGEKTFVGAGTRIWSASSITIGNYVLIAHDVNIHDNISHSTSSKERRAEIDKLLPKLTLYPHPFDLRAKPMIIEDEVWIGFGASVIGGVHIGRGSIVGAGTMVTKDVAANSVVVGNPMRVVRKAS